MRTSAAGPGVSLPPEFRLLLEETNDPQRLVSEHPQLVEHRHFDQRLADGVWRPCVFPLVTRAAVLSVAVGMFVALAPILRDSTFGFSDFGIPDNRRAGWRNVSSKAVRGIAAR